MRRSPAGFADDRNRWPPRGLSPEGLRRAGSVLVDPPPGWVATPLHPPRGWAPRPESPPDLDDQLDLEAALQEDAVGTADLAEGARAFLDKGEPRFSGC